MLDRKDLIRLIEETDWESLLVRHDRRGYTTKSSAPVFMHEVRTELLRMYDSHPNGSDEQLILFGEENARRH